MMPQTANLLHTETTSIVAVNHEKRITRTLDIMGPQVTFLCTPDQSKGQYCVMTVMVPPGVAVPLHSHADPESFYLLSGELQMLNLSESAEWHRVSAGGFLHVSGNAKHAFRNVGSDPAQVLCVSTSKIAEFFSEIGVMVDSDNPPLPPTAPRVSEFLSAVDRFGYWVSPPDEAQ